jgi:DNA-binding beta-propeller fold protein YncE
MRNLKRAWLGVLCASLLALGAGATPAHAAFDDPLFVFFASENSQPGGDFEGPCGLAVDSGGRFYVADHHHDVVDVFTSARKYETQLKNLDPLNGPCGLAVDSTGKLYVNEFHSEVARFTPTIFPITQFTTYGAGTTFDSSHPTGVAVDSSTGNVYVDDRTYVAAYDPTGAALLDGGGDPLQIGLGTLEDGYGLAFSRYPLTSGYVYVPDAADDTVKVYDPIADAVNPVATISGPPGGFVSLHDSAVAVDRANGDVYVADTLGPQFSERPQAAIYVFDYTGAYKGRLKYNVVDGGPPGLAVDNSVGLAQGRVYVTSGNTEQASVYAYPPGAATSASFPPAFSLALATSGTGGGTIGGELVDIDCATACETQVRAGASIPLTATPDPQSSFVGWSGGGCEGRGVCMVEMEEATSVRAEFAAISGPAAPPVATTSEIAQKGKLRVTVSGKLSPRSLPRSGKAPIAVSVGGEVSMTDQSLPPQLQSLRIELNRHGRLDYAGLPTCVYDRIQPASSERALTACRSALVGEGSFTANITLAGQEPYPTKGRLLVFNGRSHGKPVLFGQIYAPRPFATSFVIVFSVRELAGGTYGTVLTAPLPKALGTWGNLTGIELNLDRRFSAGGERHSYLSAGCPAPAGFTQVSFPLVRTSFAFAGGVKLTTTLVRSCKVRR